VPGRGPALRCLVCGQPAERRVLLRTHGMSSRRGRLVARLVRGRWRARHAAGWPAGRPLQHARAIVAGTAGFQASLRW
jgi:hypothetical protein